MPKYELDKRISIYREFVKPPSSLYLPIGFDMPDPSGKEIENPQKHYRQFFDDELENNKEIFSQPIFQKLEIMRAKQKKTGGFFGNLFGSSGDFESFCVGYFKGSIDVYNEELKAQQDKQIAERYQLLDKMLKEAYKRYSGEDLPLSLSMVTNREEKLKLHTMLKELKAANEKVEKFFAKWSYQSMMNTQLNTVTECIVRVYLLHAYDLASRDIGSFSDPYYKVTMGKQVKCNQKNYQLDEPNPRFYECLEFSASFPGSHPLIIELIDYDDLFGDDLIGKTQLELDDRFLNPEWKSMQYKPIEFRELYYPSSTLAQGTVVCWIDAFETKNADKECNRMFNIASEPSTEYQLRLCIYNTKNVPMKDAEGTSDVFLQAWINENLKKETDTHWRCSTGEASFNWRMLLPFISPVSGSKSEADAYKLKLNMYDRDLLSKNDFICDYELDLKLLVEECRLTKR